jgi:hypothetical protein
MTNAVTRPRRESVFHAHLVRFHYGWQDYQSAIRLLDRQSDLQGLIRWAQRKRLKHQADYYQSLLVDAERQLARLGMVAPTVLRRALALRRMAALLIPEKRVYRRGAARKYHLRKESLRNKWAKLRV